VLSGQLPANRQIASKERPGPSSMATRLPALIEQTQSFFLLIAGG
jgi:hypothetical protein